MDWNSLAAAAAFSRACHTLRGCVDWNLYSGMMILENICHTLRGCVDWNCKAVAERRAEIVTPFVGVWIETSLNSLNALREIVTPFVGVWIETPTPILVWSVRQVTPFVGVWIETPMTVQKVMRSLRHTLRGCVDWNLILREEHLLYISHTLRGCVDWNLLKCEEVEKRIESHPSWVCGLKHKCPSKCNQGIYSHTLRGCVDWNFNIFIIDTL